jgi:pyruvate/2-oxoglutarate dehydrogenase complex dihydrolipoamide dehydrogenase (E3) component
MQTDFDVLILGAGSGGYAAARTTAAAGLKTAVIEGREQVGGLCILRGCMPTKALLYAAEVMHLARHAGTWGVNVGQLGFDWPAVIARKDRMIADFADFRVKQLNDGRFTFIRDRARFRDAHTVELAGGRTLTAKHFVISTGSVVSEPPLPAVKTAGYITSDEAIRLPQPPKSLIVLGGGAVAMEFAQFFQRFGVAVTVVQRSEHILRDFDADAAAAVETALRREGMKIFTGTRLTNAGKTSAGKFVEFEQARKTMRVEAEEILFALGRTPNTAALNLAAADVRTEGARIVTDDTMQTSAPHIYAAGDCTGPYEIVHIAIQQGETAAKNIIRAMTSAAQVAQVSQPAVSPISKSAGRCNVEVSADLETRDTAGLEVCATEMHRMDYRLLTSVVFTDPQVGVVGLTEKAAKERGIPYLTASYPFNDHGKSLIMEALDGFVKLLADPKTGEIIGGACVGPLGGELIHEIVTAMHARLTVQQLAVMPHYHPTLAEIWTYPAEELAEQVVAASR